jgi:hypothetical protein
MTDKEYQKHLDYLADSSYRVGFCTACLLVGICAVLAVIAYLGYLRLHG